MWNNQNMHRNGADVITLSWGEIANTWLSHKGLLQSPLSKRHWSDLDRTQKLILTGPNCLNFTLQQLGCDSHMLNQKKTAAFAEDKPCQRLPGWEGHSIPSRSLCFPTTKQFLEGFLTISGPVSALNLFLLTCRMSQSITTLWWGSCLPLWVLQAVQVMTVWQWQSTWGWRGSPHLSNLPRLPRTSPSCVFNVSKDGFSSTSLIPISALTCSRGEFHPPWYPKFLKILSSSSTAIAPWYWLFPLVRISSLTWKMFLICQLRWNIPTGMPSLL